MAELQWDLGGLVYEMAVRDRIRVDVIVKRAAVLQDADAELGEVERILRLEETGTAGVCANCGAPHSVGASLLLAVRPAPARAGLRRGDLRRLVTAGRVGHDSLWRCDRSPSYPQVGRPDQPPSPGARHGGQPNRPVT